MRELDHLSVHQLRVLLLLLEEGSVSGAARRLGVTQPAMSHSLRALRDSLGDPLLVAGARGMTLTPRGAALAGPLRRTLRELERVLAGGGAFELATERRTFVIATGDGVTVTLLPGVLARLRDEAPGLDLDVRPVPREGSGPGLEDGVFDLAVEVRPRDQPGLKQRVIGEDEFVCLVRADHPGVGDTLDLETYLRLPHALISPQGEGTGIVDRTLAELGRTRRIALRIRYFLAAPLLVAQSDLILTAPRSIAEALLPLAPLRLFPPPLPLPRFPHALVWHERADLDPAHRWLRDAFSRRL
jgi:DNA-binding transcriptional LysR family regulator